MIMMLGGEQSQTFSSYQLYVSAHTESRLRHSFITCVVPFHLVYVVLIICLVERNPKCCDALAAISSFYCQMFLGRNCGSKTFAHPLLQHDMTPLPRFLFYYHYCNKIFILFYM